MAEIWNYSRITLTSQLRRLGVKDLPDELQQSLHGLISTPSQSTVQALIEMMLEYNHQFVMLGDPVYLLGHISLFQQKGIEIALPYIDPDSNLHLKHIVPIRHYPQIIPAKIKEMWLEKFSISMEFELDLDSNFLSETSQFCTRTIQYIFSSREELLDWYAQLEDDLSQELGINITNSDNFWDQLHSSLDIHPKKKNPSDEVIWNYSELSIRSDGLTIKVPDTSIQDEINGFQINEVPVEEDLEELSKYLVDSIASRGHSRVILAQPSHLVPYLLPLLQHRGIEVYLPGSSGELVQIARYHHLASYTMGDLEYRDGTQGCLATLQFNSASKQVIDRWEFNTCGFEGARQRVTSFMDSLRKRDLQSTLARAWYLSISNSEVVYQNMVEMLKHVTTNMANDTEMRQIRVQLHRLMGIDVLDIKRFLLYTKMGLIEQLSSNFKGSNRFLLEAKDIYDALGQSQKDLVSLFRTSAGDELGLNRIYSYDANYAYLFNLIGINYVVQGRILDSAFSFLSSTLEYQKYENGYMNSRDFELATMNYSQSYAQLHPLEKTKTFINETIRKNPGEYRVIAQLYALLANQYRKAKKYEDALHYFEKTLAIINEHQLYSYPLNSTWYNVNTMYARIQYQIGQIDQAIEHFDKVVFGDTPFEASNFDIGPVINHYLMTDYMKNQTINRRVFTKMEKMYKDGYKLDSSLYETFQAILYFEENRIDDAIKHINHILTTYADLDTSMDAISMAITLNVFARYILSHSHYQDYAQFSPVIPHILTKLGNPINQVSMDLLMYYYYFERNIGQEGTGLRKLMEHAIASNTSFSPYLTKLEKLDQGEDINLGTKILDLVSISASFDQFANHNQNN